ncbi:serine hydrolase [Mucilaginibacter sp. SMC90]|uniref:serine hydrolase domain-containing protein n=1 Tax=Mucilaginibacter sp. SMC90 TaxID=2929803 RepID=UPI001FB1DA34|nr:serine hydrolase domain-containing protein [Mucilaginibacter sp. SMC90]UOE52349.1 serine hydrolase [Mucilaginibacter sp. SMC90]
MKLNFKHVFLVVALTVLVAGETLAQRTKAANIDTLVQRANKLGLFNGNVLVVDHGKIIYKAAIGYADAGKTIKLTDQYRFHIGSIAKEFNAVGIMMLQEQGKLSLDDKLSKYLPQLPAWADKIRIINLLQYTSGLPDVKWKTVKSDADNMADLMKVDSLDFEPGKKYAYNNNNVFLQRRIIEKITGISFKQFVEDYELKPAGMNTAIVDPVEQDAHVARSYDNTGKADGLVYPISGWTAVTLDDFYAWANAIDRFKLISPVATREIINGISPGRQSGLGGGSMDNGKMISHIHDGTSLNYQALLVSNAPSGVTIILMTNNKQGNLYSIEKSIEAILANKPYMQVKRSFLDEFSSKLDLMSGDQIISFYNDLKSKRGSEFSFDDENTLNETGYYLMNKKRLADAVTVFEYNTKLFPKSGNVFDSLGEAYYNQGNKPLALMNYKKSLQLDPANDNAKKFITELDR